MVRPVILCIGLIIVTAQAQVVQGQESPASRYAATDKLYEQVLDNVTHHEGFQVIVEIDHARLAAEAGSTMPPAHVLIWSDAKLEAALLKQNPLVGLDLPLRALAFEDTKSKQPMVTFNHYAFLAYRYGLPMKDDLAQAYEQAMAVAVKGVPEKSIYRFPADKMDNKGIVTLTSSFDFETTVARLLAAINQQSDTVLFGQVDFKQRSHEVGVELPELHLIFYGGPGPGGKAMKNAPTLGLDAFCQKMLVLKNEQGQVQVVFNDLLALADRQQVSGGLPLKVINVRIKRTFSAAVTE